jgi:spore germination protein YaaH
MFKKLTSNKKYLIVAVCLIILIFGAVFSTSAGVFNTTKPTPKAQEVKDVTTSNTAITPTTSLLAPFSSTKIMAWVYPGAPACSAKDEYQDGRKIDALKPEYLKIDPNGELVILTDKDYDCNGYSKENVELIKKNSKEALFLVSGRLDGITPLFKSKEKIDKSIEVILNLVKESGFDGVEIDYEDYASWTDGQYTQFKSYIKQLGDSLHQINKKLSVDVPAIINERYQSFYKLKYEDFNDLPVDYFTLMAYDFQYDNGVGTPVASFSDIQKTIEWAKSKYTKHENIVVGLNNYGYYGKSGEYKMTLATTKAIQDKYKGVVPVRDPNSGELIGKRGGEEFVYSDSQSLDKKREIVQKQGLDKISVWHLGGNSWFSK